MSKWTKVEEALPPQGVDILFNAPACYGVEKGRLLIDMFVADRTSPYNDAVDFTLHEVDWWMLVPEPPGPPDEDGECMHVKTWGLP